MVSMVDALALVPPKAQEPEAKEESEARSSLEAHIQHMPLEDLIKYTMVPDESDRPLIVWTFEGIADHFQRKQQETDIKAIAKGALEEMRFEQEIGEDAAHDAAKGESLIQRIAEWSIKKIVKWLIKMVWKAVWKIVKWVIKKVVVNAIKGLLEWVVRPALMGILEFVGVNPELWPFIAALGGAVALGYMIWDKFFDKSEGDKSIANLRKEEDRFNQHGEAPAVQTQESTIIDQGMRAVRRSYSDIGPTGSAYPNAANAPEVAGAADGSLGGLISRGEGGYTSVNRGAAHGYKAGTEDLPNMTVAEVMAHQQAQDFNAVGRYQIIKPTLAAAVKALHLTGNEKFDKATQDRIFEQYLVGIKRSAMGNYISGKSDNLQAAVLAASQEWASVAAPAGARLANGSTGDGTVSYYAGTANNKASISAAEMARALNEARTTHSNQLKANTTIASDAMQTRDGVSVAPPVSAQAQAAANSPTGANKSVQTNSNRTVIVGKNGELIAVNA
jgi:hypothetical protein